MDPQQVVRELFPGGRPLSIDYFIIVAGVFGTFWILHVARSPVSPDDELTTGWLRAELKALTERTWRFWDSQPALFSGAAVDEQLDRCVANLLDQGVFGKAEARRMLRSSWLRRHLRRLYVEVMERDDSAVWDPSGFTHWGAMIWRASWLDRPDVLRYVKRRMEQWKERGAD